MHLPDVVVALRPVVERGGHGLPLEVESDGDALADLTGERVARVVEAHAERLEPDPPVLHRRLADEFGPERVGPDLEIARDCARGSGTS